MERTSLAVTDPTPDDNGEVGSRASITNRPKDDILPTELDADGYPVPHRCDLCARLIVDAASLRRVPPNTGWHKHRLPIDVECFDRSNLRFDTCPVYRSIRWAYVHGRHFTNGRADSTFIEAYLQFEQVREPGFSVNPQGFPIEEASLHINKTWNSSVGEGSFEEIILFAAFARKEYPSAVYTHGRRPHWDPASHDFTRLALKWIRNCPNHRFCSPYEPVPLPSRTLRISDNVKLHAAQDGECGIYAALSYCWGQGNTTVLTKELLQPWSAGIPEEELPQTLRDAIQFTRSLGIENLWIDALCIVQDDPTDVTREIPNMPQIYGNAFITIAAARTRSAVDGFLQPRVLTEAWKHCFSLPIRTLEGAMGQINFFPRAYRADHSSDPEPIHSRAWVLQEYLLSPRIIQFGVNHVTWMCHSENFTEGLSAPQVPQHYPDSDSKYMTTYYRFKPKLHHSKARQAHLTQKYGYPPKPATDYDWKELVTTYTTRKLTLPEDRPIAIAGIAAFYHELTGSTYYAGCWSHDSTALFWYSSISRTKPNQVSGVDILRNPSWSWFAIDGRVQFELSRFEDLQYTIISCDVALESPSSPFGAVKRGLLSIHAKLYPISFNVDDAGFVHAFLGQGSSPRPFQGLLFLDCTLDGCSGSVLWLMIGLHDYASWDFFDAAGKPYTKWYSQSIRGLILVEDDSYKTQIYYRRVGCFGIGHGFEIKTDAVKIQEGHEYREAFCASVERTTLTIC